MRSAPLAVVGALIFDAQDRLLIQRRSAQRALFPNCWDIVGGHVEPGETPEQALHREVAEETGWRVARVVTELPSLTWRGDDGRERTEYDYVVTVDGDLTAPRLEAGKHTEFRWVGECELHLLLEHRTVDDALRQWVASLADAIRSGYAGRVAPLLDHAFASAMRDVAQGGGRELVASFGGRDLVGMLIEFRTALAWPGRRITVRQAEAVLLGVLRPARQPHRFDRAQLEELAGGPVSVHFGQLFAAARAGDGGALGRAGAARLPYR